MKLLARMQHLDQQLSWRGFRSVYRLRKLKPERRHSRLSAQSKSRPATVAHVASPPSGAYASHIPCGRIRYDHPDRNAPSIDIASADKGAGM